MRHEAELIYSHVWYACELDFEKRDLQLLKSLQEYEAFVQSF